MSLGPAYLVSACASPCAAGFATLSAPISLVASPATSDRPPSRPRAPHRRAPPQTTRRRKNCVPISACPGRVVHDARHVRELETRLALAGAETFVALGPKLQAKLKAMQTDLIATRRELADAQQLPELAEGRILRARCAEGTWPQPAVPLPPQVMAAGIWTESAYDKAAINIKNVPCRVYLERMKLGLGTCI
ncbi:hypothetical protein GGX14DRAFT_567188 [Mycena pura]|uniref:Uncharacterized protein n=1 Tax=Mycena pura TaxID=153505 RepID=A0AAD6VF02_9AGAR|nr:hypothetical protein GGX14DRAFT_567188 [Mycena pura]